jgi:hypothetical protein
MSTQDQINIMCEHWFKIYWITWLETFEVCAFGVYCTYKICVVFIFQNYTICFVGAMRQKEHNSWNTSQIQLCIFVNLF